MMHRPFQRAVFACAFAFDVTSCAAPEAETAAYATELKECNRTAQTLAESIACENRYRAAHGRPLRPMPGDAGLATDADATDAGGDR